MLQASFIVATVPLALTFVNEMQVGDVGNKQMVPEIGIEPTTYALRMRRSTN
jgi:hypothetical protein